MLIHSQKWFVRIFDLAPTIKLDMNEEEGILGSALKSGRVQYASADLRIKVQVVTAFQGAEVVFHMAAPDSSINNYQLHYSVNVEGTKNVIDACIECKVRRLIYTSSPSVVFDGVHGIYNGDESMPYAKKMGIGEASKTRDASSLTCEEHEEHEAQRQHHVRHEQQHQQVATTAFHVSRPSNPISTIISPPPLHQTSTMSPE